MNKLTKVIILTTLTSSVANFCEAAVQVSELDAFLNQEYEFFKEKLDLQDHDEMGSGTQAFFTGNWDHVDNMSVDVTDDQSKFTPDYLLRLYEYKLKDLSEELDASRDYGTESKFLKMIEDVKNKISKLEALKNGKAAPRVNATSKLDSASAEEIKEITKETIKAIPSGSQGWQEKVEKAELENAERENPLDATELHESILQKSREESSSIENVELKRKDMLKNLDKLLFKQEAVSIPILELNNETENQNAEVTNKDPINIPTVVLTEERKAEIIEKVDSVIHEAPAILTVNVDMASKIKKAKEKTDYDLDQLFAIKASEIMYEEVVNEVTEKISKSANQVPTMVKGIVAQRIEFFESKPLAAAAASGSDDPMEFGIWGQGFGGIAKQNQNDKNDAYDSSSRGIIVGFDIAGEKGVFGGSYSYASSSLTFENLPNANVTDTHLPNLYGSYSITPSMNISAQLGLGFSTLTLQDKTEKSGMLGFVSAVGSYNYVIAEKFAISPKLGLEYFQSNYKNKETSSVSDGVKSHRTLFSFGSSVSANLGSDDLLFTPMLYIGGEFLLSGNENKDLSPVNAPSSSNNKKSTAESLTLAIDGGIDIIKSSSMKFSTGFNYKKRTDFYSLGGFLKLGVEF